MKNGDIVYLKEPHKAKYGKQGGSYYYHFPMDVGFIISDISESGTCNIYNPIDKTNHFIFSYRGGFNKLISLQEYRNMKLEKIL